MQVQEIRKKFIEFFQRKGHQYLPSSSLIPQNDPTLLFANAGMNQFKDYFTGKATSPYKRVVTIQKCVRAGGKHNDLENVGFTSRHHTFFEMLGNFSFGDYFKKEAIAYAWEFLTIDLRIPTEKLYVTVHESDDEAKKIWMEMIGLPESRIFTRDKDNFWEMGEFGPCGPCSEIFFDHGEAHASPKPGVDFLDDEQRFIEIWNLVFMQFEKTPQGTHPLPSPCIDTGSGLERLATALQGCYWNYDSDCFQSILSHLEKLSGKSAKDPLYISSMRVVADHIRSSTMLITDGVIPSNEGRGYVLRRIIRRAVRHLKDLGLQESSFYKLVPTVFESLGETYPMNKANSETAIKFLQIEEEKFRETLDLGLKFLEDSLAHLQGKVLPGDSAFKLFDTYGLPLDLTELILRERGLAVDIPGFEKALQKQKELSKQSWKGMGSSEDQSQFHQLLTQLGPTEFLGYKVLKEKGTLLFAKQSSPDDNRWILIFNRTPFYGESGGQMGDQGELFDDQGERVGLIHDTQKPVGDLFVHIAELSKPLEIGKSYQLTVNRMKRELTARNHTATHLLQQALIDVLGKHVKQSGSSVSADRLRFDFTHPTAVKKEELKQVEYLVNLKIREGLTVSPIEMNKEEAFKNGATGLFGEKYGDRVRVINISDYSKELCGGTHIHNTAEIGYFSIVGESALSSGIRRIEALSSDMALQRLQERSLAMEKVEFLVKLPANQVPSRIEQMMEKMKSLESDKIKLTTQIDQFKSEQIFLHPEQFANGLIFKSVELPEGSDLRRFSDYFVDQHPKGVVLLHMVAKGKRSILLRTHKENHAIDCAQILSQTLPLLQGKGGGRKDLAQGPGSVDAPFDQFLQKVKEIVGKI